MSEKTRVELPETPDELYALLRDRAKSGELSEQIIRLLFEWFLAERRLDQESMQARTVMVLVMFLALPIGERYEFLEDYIKARLREIEEELRGK
jgi:hypothetical protein